MRTVSRDGYVAAAARLPRGTLHPARVPEGKVNLTIPTPRVASQVTLPP